MPTVIAEIGCNHQGNMDLARDHIRAAAACGADYVKFQKRDNDFHREHNPDWDKPHPNGGHAFGATYYEHRQALEFSQDEHILLKSYAERHDIGYACSAWDATSALEIATLEPDYIKIPSAMNTNTALLDTCYQNFRKLHISLGMTTDEERDRLLLPAQHDPDGYFIYYHCTSGYPVPFDELYLKEIGGHIKGFSGHHLGIAVDIAAYTLGAEFIERHFTLDRTMKGTDHSASLEPGGLSKLVRDLKAAEKALRCKTDEISPIEVTQREKLKWRPSCV